MKQIPFGEIEIGGRYLVFSKSIKGKLEGFAVMKYKGDSYWEYPTESSWLDSSLFEITKYIEPDPEQTTVYELPKEPLPKLWMDDIIWVDEEDTGEYKPFHFHSWGDYRSANYFTGGRSSKTAPQSETKYSEDGLYGFTSTASEDLWEVR